MNIASPTSTWLGGSCCVPIAWRSSDSTMMIRVKLVIISRIAGASESTVSRTTICIADEKFSRLEISGRLRPTAESGSSPPGRTAACAAGKIGIERRR